MMRLHTLLAAIGLMAATVQPGLAEDPPGSTPSDPRPAAPGAPPLIDLVVPDSRPAVPGISVPLPPPSFSDATDDSADIDGYVDSIIMMQPPMPGRGAEFDVADAGDEDEVQSAANCWDDGLGCGPEGRAQFIANCDEQGGVLSSHWGGNINGGYIRCTVE